MMDRSQQPEASAGGDRLSKLEDQVKRRRKEPSFAGVDRLSKLEDHVLGNILSFLPAKEAARAALLSSRWRPVFAAVHTVSLEEPEGTDTDAGCDSTRKPDPNAPPPFPSVVSAAIIARQRRRGAAPLRALRVAMEGCSGSNSSTVDQWVSYAVQQAAPGGLDLGLSFCCRRTHLLCYYPYELRYRVPVPEPDMVCDYPPAPCPLPESTADVGCESESESEPNMDDGSVVSSDDDERDNHHDPPLLCDSPQYTVPTEDDDEQDNHHDPHPPVMCDTHTPEYTVPGVIFSCAELRSLSLTSCRLAPPATVSLPSLVTLLLSHVPDAGADVERLVAGCPRLADLTLEACDAVTALSLLGGARLRRLALRCCHKLTTVAVDSSELRAFEYRGAVPDNASFLTMHGGTGRVAYCKVDVCGAEATSEEELTNMRHLLQLFVNASIRHLEMRGRLPDYDTTGVIEAMSRILELVPNLEVLSLAFHPQKHEWDHWHENEIVAFTQEERLDAHHLSYNPYSVLDAAPTTMMIPPCLKSGVREINLVHYQGGTAQRALAKFLLCNAPAVDKLWCEFAEGPLWTQIQLMREIKGWLINKSANTHFA